MSLVDLSDAAQTAFDHVPVIDIADARSANPAARRALAVNVRDACMSAGFFYVKNHDVPEPIIDSAFDSVRAFFDLPLETKMELDMKKTPNFKGYNPLFSAKNDAASTLADAHEGFELGWEALDDEGGAGAPASGAMKGANVWPDERAAPEFRRNVLRYYHATVELGKTLFPLFALALDLPEDFFNDKTRQSAALLRVLHYPPQPAKDEKTAKSLGIGAHTDWEVFTILWQQPGIQALEVQKPDGTWLPVPSLDGTFVVNLGDMLARWTNGVFKSTVHRASNASGLERYSIPLFFGTDYDVLLRPIASCVSEERPNEYEVVTAGEYVRARAQATYGH